MSIWTDGCVKLKYLLKIDLNIIDSISKSRDFVYRFILYFKENWFKYFNWLYHNNLDQRRLDCVVVLYNFMLGVSFNLEC